MLGVTTASETAGVKTGPAVPAVPAVQSTKETLKMFLARLRVAPRDKIECAVCWE